MNLMLGTGKFANQKGSLVSEEELSCGADNLSNHEPTATRSLTRQTHVLGAKRREFDKAMLDALGFGRTGLAPPAVSMLGLGLL